ncbi:unnamed protein product, partial [Rhizoctonia solani]
MGFRPDLTAHLRPARSIDQLNNSRVNALKTSGIGPKHMYRMRISSYCLLHPVPHHGTSTREIFCALPYVDKDKSMSQGVALYPVSAVERHTLKFIRA